METVVNIPISQLIFASNVRRVSIQDEDIMELAKSLDENGQEVEIRVYPDQYGNYVVKAGHRRALAAMLLYWHDIRAIVEEPPSDEAALLIDQTIENDHRLGMGYLDKARVYLRLKELGWNQHQIAQRFALSDAEVSLALSTLQASPKLQEAVEQGKIKPSAIEPLLSQPINVQEELAERAIREKTVRRVAALVKTYQMFKDTEDMVVSEEKDEIPEDVDPLEVLAIDELKQALEHLENVRQTGIRHPELRRTARPTVEQLVKQAASIKKFLDGDVWPDAKDLA